MNTNRYNKAIDRIRELETLNGFKQISLACYNQTELDEYLEFLWQHIKNDTNY